MTKNYQSGKGNYKLLLDISENETPDFTEVRPTNLGFDSGEELDTWHDLLSEIANNVKTAIDPTWSITLKFDKDDPVCKFIIDKELKTGLDATAKAQLVNMLKGANGKQIDFTATFSNVNYELETPSVIEVNFDLKVFDNETFEEDDYE